MMDIAFHLPKRSTVTNYKILWKPVIAALLVLLLCLVAWTQQKQNASKVKWEYMKTGWVDQAVLNKLGEEGWELVAIQQWNDGEAASTFFFKRPK
jgi:hypothetical protein